MIHTYRRRACICVARGYTRSISTTLQSRALLVYAWLEIAFDCVCIHIVFDVMTVCVCIYIVCIVCGDIYIVRVHAICAFMSCAYGVYTYYMHMSRIHVLVIYITSVHAIRAFMSCICIFSVCMSRVYTCVCIHTVSVYVTIVYVYIYVYSQCVCCMCIYLDMYVVS